MTSHRSLEQREIPGETAEVSFRGPATPLVVVVDDQTAGRKILEQVIRGIGSGIEVVSFDDAARALEFIRGETPDLIVTDYLMPTLDGVGFVRSVRCTPGCDDVPIIVVTVVDDRRVRYQALDAGATDFLSRPIDEHECRARCRNLLTLRHQHQVLRERARSLAESERRFRIMADELPLIVWVEGSDGSVVFVNKTGCEYFGLSEEEMAGERWQRLLHPDDRERYLGSYAPKLAAREPHQDQCRMRRADGEWRWVESFARPYYSPAGVFAGVVGAGLDITERKAAEESLHLSHLELGRRSEQLARLTSQLTLTEQRERKRLAKVIHDDLQQLLVGATFSVERVERRLIPSADTQALRDTLRSAGDLLAQAIGVARGLVGDLSPPILHDAGLPEALEWLARRMRQRFGLDVVLCLDQHASPAPEDVRSVVFDAAREALFNVVKHAGVKRAWLTLSATAGRLRLVVEDQGAGFDAAARREDQGSEAGFGLFSLRERLHLLRGDIDIGSTPGGGTTVVVTLALSGGTGPGDGGGAGEGTAGGAVAGEADAGVVEGASTGIRLLLVDDHAMLRRALASMLAAEPDLCVAGEAADGHEAIDAVERLAPDVVLMDISMPRMDGLEATRRIRARWPRVQVIGLSMHDRADRADAMLDAGAAAYLSKSGEIELLFQTIRRLSTADAGRTPD
jgi:PAS domain S-box-containing protein